MNLSKKKELASRVLKVGKARIRFIEARLSEVKEAITSQDIRDLVKNKAIEIKEIKGRKKIVKRTTRRGHGKIKKKVNTRKQDYVIKTRKFRTYVKNLKEKGDITHEDHIKLRKEIRNSTFKSKAHLKDTIGEMKK